MCSPPGLRTPGRGEADWTKIRVAARAAIAKPEDEPRWAREVLVSSYSVCRAKAQIALGEAPKDVTFTLPLDLDAHAEHVRGVASQRLGVKLTRAELLELLLDAALDAGFLDDLRPASEVEAGGEDATAPGPAASADALEEGDAVDAALDRVEGPAKPGGAASSTRRDVPARIAVPTTCLASSVRTSRSAYGRRGDFREGGRHGRVDLEPHGRATSTSATTASRDQGLWLAPMRVGEGAWRRSAELVERRRAGHAARVSEATDVSLVGRPPGAWWLTAAAAGIWLVFFVLALLSPALARWLDLPAFGVPALPWHPSSPVTAALLLGVLASARWPGVRPHLESDFLGLAIRVGLVASVTVALALGVLGRPDSTSPGARDVAIVALFMLCGFVSLLGAFSLVVVWLGFVYDVAHLPRGHPARELVRATHVAAPAIVAIVIGTSVWADTVGPGPLVLVPGQLAVATTLSGLVLGGALWLRLRARPGDA